MIFSKLSLVPTVLILIFLIKVVNGQFDDPDFYWHLKTGEYIVAQGLLPQADVFSHTNLGRPWVLHEWLFQVLIYLLHVAGGELGIKIFVALMLAACFWFCYSICEKILEGDKAKALIVALLYCSIITSVSPRPHLFTFLFFALFLHILLSFKYYGETGRLLGDPAGHGFLGQPAWRVFHRPGTGLAVHPGRMGDKPARRGNGSAEAPASQTTDPHRCRGRCSRPWQTPNSFAIGCIPSR